MSCCTNPTYPIIKEETQTWVEIPSESDELPNQDKTFSPMSITSEVISDGWEKKSNNRLLEMESKTKSVEKLKMDMQKSTEKIVNLIKEKKLLGKKLAKLKDPSLIVNSSSKSNIEVLKSELKSWEERYKSQEMQIIELWNVIQTQDDDNVKLKLDAEEWKDRESKMNDELMVLKEALKNPKNNQTRDRFIYVSTITDDWKSRLESDLNRCQNGSERSFQKTQKVKGWQKKRMIKFGSRKDFSAKNCKKHPFRGSGKEDKWPRKFNRRINVQRRPVNNGRLSKDPRLM